MKLYRVIYEKRLKPRCSCCEYKETEPAHHAWLVETTTPTNDKKKAERDESDVYEHNDPTSSSYEVRNVRIEQAEITEWTAVNAWEEPK